jgi:acetoacetate decarboxylase
MSAACTGVTAPAPYPPPPWRLVGTSVQSLALVPIEVVRAEVPAELHVVPVAPGKTLCALFCAQYVAGSTLCYHELAIAPALIRVGYRPGFWISHIYVDSLASLLGGRSIWSLPKQLARFQWSDGAIDVFDESMHLCGIRWKPRRYGVPLPLYVPVFSRGESQFHRFSAGGRATTRPCAGSTRIGPGSPFAPLGFQSTRVIFQTTFHARITAPEPLHIHQ